MYAGVPPEIVWLIAPFEPPLQVGFDITAVAVIPVAGSVIVTVLVIVQLFASVTVTVYVPAGIFVKSSVAAPLLQLYT